MTGEDGDQEDDTSTKTVSFEAEAHRAAATYSWEFFKYHAQQRQAVFRFYLIIVGASFAGITSLSSTSDKFAQNWSFGLILTIASFLFWRLDRRNLKFIKISEEYLMFEEARLAEIVQTDRIEIITKIRAMAKSVFPLTYLTTFQQIYRTIFLIVGFIGLVLIYSDAHKKLIEYRISLDSTGFSYQKISN